MIFSRPFHGLTIDATLDPSSELLGYFRSSVSRTIAPNARETSITPF